MKFPYETEAGFTILDAKNPKWSCRDKGHLTCDLVVTGGAFGESEMEIPFTAHPDDTELHSKEVFKHFKRKSIQQYERPEVTVKDLQDDLDKLMPDIILGLATDEEISLAKALRIQIKSMEG